MPTQALYCHRGSSVYNSSEIVAVALNISLLLVNKRASKHYQLYIVHMDVFSRHSYTCTDIHAYNLCAEHVTRV